MVDLIFKKRFCFKGRAELISEKVEKIISIINDKNLKIEDIDFRLELSLREMLANAIEHGCNTEDDYRQIKICLEITDCYISLSVKDPGEGFNWQSRNLDDLPIYSESGRGLAMINKMVDKVKFNKCGNKIRVYFNLD